MKTMLALPLALLFAATALANPVLHGTWSAADVGGAPLKVEFAADKTGKINGQPMRWDTLGGALFVQRSGQTIAYGFRVDGNKLLVSGGDLAQPATLTKGGGAYDAAMKAKAGAAPVKAAAQGADGGRELVGKWCNAAQFSANAGGGSSRMECFELKADGTYTYSREGSMSAYAPGMYGGTASQSGDAGRWTYRGNQLIAQSRSGQTHTYNLEKRNHPKNKRDPMICLDGTCYVTFYNRPAW